MKISPRYLAMLKLATMTLPPPLRALGFQLDQRWQQLTPAGQRVISLAAVLLIIGLCWALVYEPLQRSRTNNTAAISKADAELAIVKAQAAEVARIRTLAPVAASATRTAADIASLQSLFGPTVVVSIAPASQASAGLSFRLVVSPTSYAELVDRIDLATTKFRLQVTGLNLKRREAAGVSGDITLTDTR